MKKIALFVFAAVPAALFAMGADCSGSNVTSCTSDADCADTADTPACIDGTCQTQQCTEDSQCQVTDSGGSDTCTSDSDCSDGDKCLEGDTGNSHCVTPLAAGDPSCADQGNAADPPISEESVTVSGTEFCADTSVNCGTDNVCHGGQFGS